MLPPSVMVTYMPACCMVKFLLPNGTDSTGQDLILDLVPLKVFWSALMKQQQIEGWEASPSPFYKSEREHDTYHLHIPIYHIDI